MIRADALRSMRPDRCASGPDADDDATPAIDAPHTTPRRHTLHGTRATLRRKGKETIRTQ
jgi:hypothetical protein